MGYKLVISEYADELLNNLIYYLIYRLKNEPAAKHLLDGIDTIGGGGKGAEDIVNTQITKLPGREFHPGRKYAAVCVIPCG